MENSCTRPECDRSATMQCPTCVKLKLKPAFYCNQECFKKNWPQHKLLHQRERAFPWTGPLRPYKILDTCTSVPSHIPRPDYSTMTLNKSAALYKIPVMTPKDVKGMRKVCKLGRQILNMAGNGETRCHHKFH